MAKKIVDAYLWEMTPFPADSASFRQLLTGIELVCRLDPSAIRAREMDKFDRMWARFKEEDKARDNRRHKRKR